MKRIFTILACVFVLSSLANAQTFAILNSSNEVITGNTIVVPITVGNDAEYDIKVQNLTGSIVSAKISRTYLEGPVAGYFDSMCTPATETSGGACVSSPTTPTFILNPNEISGLAAMHFNQGPNAGVSTVRYKVYNTANESDFVYVIVSYSTQTSINTTLAKDFNVYPNPARNSFTIEHNFGSKAVVEVFNVLGKSVAKLNSNSTTQFNIDCSKWENGYYFCRLYNDGKVEKTVKLVVTH